MYKKLLILTPLNFHKILAVKNRKKKAFNKFFQINQYELNKLLDQIQLDDKKA